MVLYLSGNNALPLCLLGCVPGVYVVLHSHEVHQFPTNMFLTAVSRFLARQADRIIAVSDFHRASLSEDWKIPRVEKIYNAVTPGAALPQPMRNGRLAQINFIYVGGATAQKGIGVVEKFARLLASRGRHKMTLCLSRAGAMQSGLVAELEANPRVSVIYDADDVLGVLRTHDFLIAPSRPVICRETFGRVLVEAAMAGCWPLATAAGAYPELIRELGVGDVVSAGPDDDALAEQFLYIAESRCGSVGSKVPNLSPFDYSSFKGQLLNVALPPEI